MPSTVPEQKLANVQQTISALLLKAAYNSKLTLKKLVQDTKT